MADNKCTETKDETPHRSRSRRDHAFLAERTMFWMPGRTLEEVTRLLGSLSDEQYWETFREVFKANTVHNLVYALAILARTGWFIDFDFPPPSATRVAEMVEDGESEGAFTLLEDYFEGRRSEIESELIGRFSLREKILRTGFRLHDAGDYDASVPLFLAQADGICHDVYGAELFRMKQGAVAVQAKVKRKRVDWIWDAASTPLRLALPLAFPERPGKGKFNRHLILHGRCLDYGTRRNSLRAISLLSYLQGMAEYERNAESRDLLTAAKS